MFAVEPDAGNLEIDGNVEEADDGPFICLDAADEEDSDEVEEEAEE